MFKKGDKVKVVDYSKPGSELIGQVGVITKANKDANAGDDFFEVKLEGNPEIQYFYLCELKKIK